MVALGHRTTLQVYRVIFTDEDAMHWPDEDIGNLRVALNALFWLFRLWPWNSAAWATAVLPLNYAHNAVRLVEVGRGDKGGGWMETPPREGWRLRTRHLPSLSWLDSR